MPTQPGSWTKSLFGVPGPGVGGVTLQQEGPNHREKWIFKLDTNLQTYRNLINHNKKLQADFGD